MEPEIGELVTVIKAKSYLGQPPHTTGMTGMFVSKTDHHADVRFSSFEHWHYQFDQIRKCNYLEKIIYEI